tara:strand:- start:2611 stop:4158 length:1548 start_codon:yes stop_codon:yes gene_type:complete
MSNINKINRLKLSPIKDISKSLLKISWVNNPTLNRDFFPLHTCKKENFDITTLYNKPKNNNFKKSLEIMDNSLNMTIQNILNDMSNKRKKNINNTPNIRDSIDKNVFLNNTENKLIPYSKKLNRKQALDELLLSIDSLHKNLSEKSSLFNYHSKFNDTKTHVFPMRRKKIYYSSPLNPNNLRLPPPPPIIKKTKVNIEREIDSLDDILKLIKDYPIKVDVEYNINMSAIHNIKDPLLELKNMIGMNKLKNAIVDQILYFIQEFHKLSRNSNDFMHTVIYGPPGTGKTETAKIIGKIFSKLGILSKNYFKKVTRADLIAGYLGQTALKTRDVIKDAVGGVLFIDEAYALGNSEKRDSFAKECIDTLCEGLSDNKDNLMVIIAGYEKELKECFFAYNQGLDSRFNWRFNTDDYSYEELYLIFKKKVNDIGWKLDEKVNKYWFEDKMDFFKFYGRDIETLLAKVKIAHGRRVFCLPIEKKMIINLKDLNKGYDMFLDNNEVKSRKDTTSKDILNQMYC